MFEPSQESGFFSISGFYPESLLEAPLAKTSAPPTPKAKASKASGAASTSKQSALSEKSALVGSLLRTALISELKAQTPFSLHWKPSATPAGRSWSVLRTSAPTMSAPDPGSLDVTSAKLPTPITNPYGGQSNPGLKAKGVIYPALSPLLEISAGRMEPGRYLGDMEGWAKLPTPMASDGKVDGKGGGAGSTYEFRMILATPRKSDADRGFRGDLLAQLQGQNNRHAGMLSTPRASDMKAGGHGDDGRMGTVRHQLQRAMMPTPLASDRKGSLGIHGANGKVKSQNVPTFLRDGKWNYARQIADMLTAAGLTGPSMTLPVTYGWMMGYPPGWLALALRSAVHAGHLPLASSLKRSVTQ